jgi:uncharacterized SAM-binding protein YcdF (DUF218 family)
MTEQKKTRRARLALKILTVFLIGVLVFMIFLDRWGQSDRAQKVDAIVVLGAYVKPNGQASNALRNRAMHAARLYHRGLASHVITTGGLGDNPPAEALVSAAILRRNGVPSNAISSEVTSTSTWENAANAARICREKGWKRVIIVSEPFHLWRATRNFQKHGLTAYASPSLDRRVRFRLWMTAREVPAVLRDVFTRRVW